MSQMPIQMQIEYPHVRLPYEYTVKCEHIPSLVIEYKNQRRQVEQDIADIMKQIIDIQNDPNVDIVLAQERINSLIAQLHKLKQKVSENYQELDHSYGMIKKRLTHLQNLDDPCQHDIKLNRLIVDQLMRFGHFKTANKMMDTYELHDFSEMEYRLIRESNAILNDLKSRSTKEALKWCVANRTRLQKLGDSFEFQLIFQDFIELLKKSMVDEALVYLRKSISRYGSDFKYLNEVKKAMGCILVLKQIDKFPEYLYYFEDARWDDLVKTFRYGMQNVYALQVDAPLYCERNFRVVSKVLKLFTVTSNSNLLFVLYVMRQWHLYKYIYQQELVAKVPGTQKGHSTWICRITGEIMDEHNPPLMLPNAQVYSTKALRKMADKMNNKIICPITKDEFDFDKVTRVYLS